MTTKEMTRGPVIVALACVAALDVGAQVPSMAFDSFSAPTLGYSSTDPSTSYGALLSITQAGTLESVGFTLYNHENSGGNIVAGSMKLTFYDASNGYSGGSLNLPVLGSVAVPLDLYGSPLTPGWGNTFSSGDLSAKNIVLPSKILLTQQFELTQGTATRYGIAASGTVPSIGSSTGKYFMSNSQNSAGLYSAAGGGSAYPLYRLSVNPSIVVPEPAAAASLASLGLLGWMFWRQCGRSAS